MEKKCARELKSRKRQHTHTHTHLVAAATYDNDVAIGVELNASKIQFRQVKRAFKIFEFALKLEGLGSDLERRWKFVPFFMAFSRTIGFPQQQQEQKTSSSVCARKQKTTFVERELIMSFLLDIYLNPSYE